MFYYITALTIGLMGSLHCVGMCGPIALALPLEYKYKNQRWLATFNYFLGKTVTYGILGFFSGFFSWISVFYGFQQYLSIFSGLLIIALLMIEYSNRVKTAIQKLNLRQLSLLRIKFYQNLNKKNLVSSFILGLLNGMLPCGLVYFALAASVGAGGLLEGILYMILFGLGTIPLLLVVITLKTQERIISGKIFKKIIPLFSLTLAILLITRGLNLGLPYLSPKISEKTQKIEIKCCSKANSKSP